MKFVCPCVIALVVLHAGAARADEESAPAPPLAPASLPEAQAPRAPEAPHESVPERQAFGAAGTVVLDDVLGFGFGGPFLAGPGGVGTPVMTGWINYSSATLEWQGMSGHNQTLGIAPSIDVFASNGFSIGAAATFFYSVNRQGGGEPGASSTTVGGALRPRIGFAIPLGSRFALWPRASVSIGGSHARDVPALVDGVPELTANTSVSWAVGGEALFVATVMRPVSFTFGPTIGYAKSDVVSGDSSTAISSRAFSVGARGGISLVF